jgi:DNA-binding transcriptional regulator PaaX
MKSEDIEGVLDALGWMLDKLSRPTLGNWLGGYAGYDGRDSARRVVARLQREELIVRGRHGRELKFTVTEKGRSRIAAGHPEHCWRQPWDGNWHALTFDVPEVRRKDRLAVWKALRARKIGFLQRSLWVWPHNLQAVVKEIIRVEGVPECFCGFTTRQVWLCNDAEIVASSWDWEEIERRQEAYLRQSDAGLKTVATASSVEKLAEAARVEWGAYRAAFAMDPLLPRRLLPDGYAGPKILTRHKEFGQVMAARMAHMAG